jgi:hypothetical protein
MGISPTVRRSITVAIYADGRGIPSGRIIVEIMSSSIYETAHSVFPDIVVHNEPLLKICYPSGNGIHSIIHLQRDSNEKCTVVLRG